MTTFRAKINIMPRAELLDPKGKAVEKNLGSLQLDELSNVRIGKRIHLAVEATDRSAAEAKVERACRELLANQIMESYEFELVEA